MDIEQLVRQELADDRHTQEGWPDPVKQVQTGIRRRRQRQYAVMCSVAVITALAGFGAVSVLHEPAPGPVEPAQGPIAWSPSPATLPNLARRSPRPDVRGCTGSDLAGKPWVQTAPPGTGGKTLYTVLVANGSDTRCTLSGSPQFTASEIGSGTSAPFIAGTQSLQLPQQQAPATIDPGEPARVDIVVTPCTGTAVPKYRSLALMIGEHHFEIPDITLGCETAVTRWYVEAPLINAPLTVTMTAPDSARRGTTLAYRVTIANTFDQPFALQPCPAYQEGIATSSRTYRLNCSTASIPAHGSLTYEMRLNVSDNAALGPTKLTWTAAFTNGTVAIANLSSSGSTVQILP